AHRTPPAPAGAVGAVGGAGGPVVDWKRAHREEPVMYVLRVEHSVPEYEAWKRAFDGDPLGRGAVGVRAYRVMRPVGDPGRVLIDLDFDDREPAERMLIRLRELWSRLPAATPPPDGELTEVMETGRY
ncbi:hypothetical protein ACFV08_25905, partial [Streptomyces fradiae]|uniref:hypothetical protein n=1 Tax=Streptomyces fradiae TaxID=1906 RepID=UPI0036B9D0F6